MTNITFFTPERMNIFYGYLWSIFKLVSPALMIAMSIMAVGLLFYIIVSTMRKARDEQYNESNYSEHRQARDYDDDDDYRRR